jgi:PEP-CTERM motif
MKKILMALAMATIGAQASALTPGDLAIIAYNSDGDDNFAWVALTDIAANTVINFTDSSWQGTAFRPTEHLDTSGGGPLSWSYTGVLAAGTVVTYAGSAANSWNLGTSTGSGMSLSTNGDQIFAFQGTNSSPAMLYGTQFAVANGVIAAPTVSNLTTTTNVPSALAAVPGTMVDFGNFDDGYYSGPTNGSRTALLAAIANTANWTQGNDSYATSNWASSFQVTTVPEPETYAMLLAGLGLMGAVARRRKV